MTVKAHAMIPAIAKSTVGYSGSDLKELCRAAAMEPIREMTRLSSQKAVMAMEEEEKHPSLTVLESDKSLKQLNKISKIQRQQKPKKKNVFGPPRGHKVRAVNEMDFAAALEKVKRTGETAKNFRLNEDEHAGSIAGQDMTDFAEQMKMLQTLLSNTNSVKEDKSSVESDDIPNIM